MQRLYRDNPAPCIWRFLLNLLFTKASLSDAITTGEIQMSQNQTIQPQSEVDLSGERDWEAFDAAALVGESLRFVSGEPDGERYRVRYYKNSAGELRARIWFGPETQGPPGHVHGGAMAAVFDEVLGLAAWTAGYPIVTGNLNVSFRNLLPIQHVATVVSTVESVNGRKVLVKGRLCSGDKVFAEAECLCITIKEDRLNATSA
jgi:acyl-coenzyme A thioesterase PaaI-like protein